MKKAALVAAIVLLAALGLEVARRLSAARAVARPLAAPPQLRLGSAPPPGSSLAADDTLDLLALPAGGAAAERVVRELGADPRLKRRWDGIVANFPGEGKGALLEELADDEGFEEMLRRLKGDPEFEKELEPARAEAKRELARAQRLGSGSPDGSRMLALSPGGAGSREVIGTSGLRAGAARGPLGRAGRLGIVRDLRGAAPAGPVASSRAVGPSAGPAAFDPIGASAPVAEYRPPSAPAQTARADERNVRKATPAGAEAHNVTAALAPTVNADSEMMKRLLEQYPFLANLSDDERRVIIQHIGQDGLWGACFRLNLYARCETACREAPTKCRVVEGWDACLQFKDNDTAACAALCPQQPGCRLPAGVGGGPTSGGSSSGGTSGTSGSACPYEGRSCEQICSPFQLSGSCGSDCVRWNRSCPGDSRCDVSVQQNLGESPSQSSSPCP